MASLQGRHALVTGGGRGIGRAIAAALMQAGAAVTIAGRNEKPLAEAVGKGEASGLCDRRRHRRARLWTAACSRPSRRGARSIF